MIIMINKNGNYDKIMKGFFLPKHFKCYNLKGHKLPSIINSTWKTVHSKNWLFPKSQWKTMVKRPMLCCCQTPSSCPSSVERLHGSV